MDTTTRISFKRLRPRVGQHWRDRMAGWSLWIVTYPGGTTEKLEGTREDVRRYAFDKWNATQSAQGGTR